MEITAQTCRRCVLVLLTICILAAACSGGSPEPAAVEAPSSTPVVASPTPAPTPTALPSEDPTATAAPTATPAATPTPLLTPTPAPTPTAVPAGPSVVRIGPITIRRTEPCPAVTVAPTFSLSFNSDAGLEFIPDEEASQLVVGESSPTVVFPGRSFQPAGAWELNVRMLEHLTGVTSEATYAGPTQHTAGFFVDGLPIDMSYSITEQATVDMSDVRLQVSGSCQMIQPGFTVAFTDVVGPILIGDTIPVFETAQNLPLDSAVTFFDGAEFETPDLTDWAVSVFVTDHWTGRTHQADHMDPGTKTSPLPGLNPGDPAWEIEYTISVD